MRAPPAPPERDFAAGGSPAAMPFSDAVRSPNEPGAFRCQRFVRRLPGGVGSSSATLSRNAGSTSASNHGCCLSQP
ncbi:hypothetical protein Y025_3560 [Burkholderia pseudomallei TSV32]|nr:hypothetical protein Y025_3560 [Burkholderia pseudomallei TSV32]